MSETPTQETIKAYVDLNEKKFLQKNNIKDIGAITTNDINKSPNFKSKVKVWSYADKQTHKYFHSMNIDVQVQDFTGTCELRAPYDNRLMEYWKPIYSTCVVYGTNKGAYKILFVGRVREIKQDGYELVLTLQNYGWKFQQNASTSFVEDNIKGKDGYTIMKLIFEALKIDSWVISPSAKKRLKEVGFDDDGNLTLNGQEIKEMPDLLERIKAANPSESIDNYTIYNKIKEDNLSNIKNLNYTLKYEEPTPVMKEIANQSNYSKGSNVYSQSYGSVAQGGTSTTTSTASGGTRVTKDVLKKCGCTGKYIDSTTMHSALSTIYKIYHCGAARSSGVGPKQQIAQYIVKIDAYPKIKDNLYNCLYTMKKQASNSCNKDFVVWPTAAELATARKGIYGVSASKNEITTTVKNGMFGVKVGNNDLSWYTKLLRSGSSR